MQRAIKGSFQIITLRVISLLFNPLFAPLYGLLIIFFAPTFFWYLPIRVKEIFFFIYLINNVLIPVSLMPFFRFRNIISSLTIENRRERIIPLVTVTILYSVTSFIMFRLQIPAFLKAYSYGLTLLSAALLLANLKWKISLYSAGAGMLFSLILILSMKLSSGLPLLIILSLFVSGIILSSRLKLNTHNPFEVYFGFILGFVISGAGILLFQ